MNRRTRIVRWLRVLLPLLALGVLSTMFLLSRQPATEPRIPYVAVDAEQMAQGPRVVSPDYAGVTSDGARISLRAGQATPAGGTGDGTASDVRLDWIRPDGLRADLTSPDAAVADGLIRLRGGVRMTTSTGWTLDTPNMDAATDRSRLAAADGVVATAPFGRITSEAMELLPRNDRDDAAILNFSGDVRLIYQP